MEYEGSLSMPRVLKTLRDEQRILVEKAAGLVLEVVRSFQSERFRSEEEALAFALSEVGQVATRKLLEAYVGPEPERAKVDGVVYRRVLENASARIQTPFGLISIRRARYRREGERGIKGATTIGLLEKRAGLLDGMTPRMAELTTSFDASVPSRESERLMDLAGLSGPRRAGLEKKAGRIGSELMANIDERFEQARALQSLPEGAATLTIGMDRVSVPYEEANPGGQKSERTRQLRTKKPYKRKEPEPIVRVFHGDFVGNVSIRDQYGELIQSYTYGLSHTENPSRMADWLVGDVVAALRQCPNLAISVCQDGARELWPTLWEALKRAPELQEVSVQACVDFHHFIPRVRTVVTLLWDEEAFLKWKRRILDEPGAVFDLEEAILQEGQQRLAQQELSGEQLDAIHHFQTYIEERVRKDGREDRRAELFDYAQLRSAGLPIGSGTVEACAKSLASVRMKRSGCRWSESGASATLLCRGITLSVGRWELIWPEFADSKVANVIPLNSVNDNPRPRQRAA